MGGRFPAAGLALALALAAALLTTGCGEDREPGVPAGPLAVYVSAPAHGPEARAGAAVRAGARQALRDAGGRAGGRRVRLIALPANRPGDPGWDPGTVEANAKRAADDARAIAYIGEMNGGGSAVSVPRTNEAGLLQVSPADGLTSLTRPSPERLRAGAVRYYPAGHRTFLRLVPSDREVSHAMVARARPEPGRRIALAETADVSQRELGAALVSDLRAAGDPSVGGVALRDSPDAVPGGVDHLAELRPDTVLVAGEPGPVATALIAALGRRLPSASLVGSPGLAGRRLARGRRAVAVTPVLPASLQPRRGRALLGRLGPAERPEALYAYDAMALVLGSVRRAGADRDAIVRAALRPRPVRGLTGPYRVERGGDVSRPGVAVIDLSTRRATVQPVD